MKFAYNHFGLLQFATKKVPWYLAVVLWVYFWFVLGIICIHQLYLKYLVHK